MHYDGVVTECLAFMMTALRTLKISQMMRYHEKHFDALDCLAFSCHKEVTEQS